MPTDTERREVARRLRAFSEKLGYISIPYLASAIGAEKSDPKSLYGRLVDLIEPAAWRDFAADPPSEKRPVLCKSRNGRYYVGSPCFFANDTFTGKVWVPRGANYRRPEKWMEIDAATCEKCDRDALLELADEIERYADGGGARFGRVIDSRRAKGYAQRIREALGVRDG